MLDADDAVLHAEDTKGVIRIRLSKNRQHDDVKNKYKRTNDDL
jgi:hypothetical protein